ncbi:MAG: acylglycerol lipase [Bradymonadia bacterium]|jgi:acylglycerol lipase
MTQVISRYLDTPDGRRLFLRELGDTGAEKTLVVVHGYGEHGGRYIERLQAFVEDGYRVLIADQRGHGRSDGPRGHVRRFQRYHDDLELVLAEAQSSAENTVLFGHSAGGLIVLSALLQRTLPVAAAALSSPLLGLAITPPKWKETLGRAVARVLPRVSLPTEIEANMVSRDPDVVRGYETDPLIHHVVNTRWFVETTATMTACLADAAKLPVPAFVMQSGEDKLVSADASAQFAQAAGCEFECVEGAYHELWFEPDGERYAEQMRQWLNLRVAA